MKKQNTIDYDSLWEKVGSFAKKAGRMSARPALLLYHVLKSPGTPPADRLLIVSALSYLVLPVDLISAKRLPVIGWIDEALSLAYAYQKVCKHITPEMEAETDKLLDRWFPEFTAYEIVVDSKEA